ncbi:hypothetical protein GCM10009548_81280 [Streptomyces malaysiensis subsp. malaysiensis]|uniref:Integral membrane protein n=1 Tax=Streptomyces malaysiensis TaxID=92644 RepID=A0ABX6W8E5_STRMQ|nr:MULTISPECIES: hypothetical protein [Streptomyces]ATL84431.1 integral membrane protein [Streptomyces malaysiensis]MCQ6251074.1 hypothetical protein [Streptomyces malaysiensis]QDL71640.1 hypothetical protein DNK48_22115 [Streptomyces malaysiensis]QPI57727.1 hypothetical protein I1A49_25000 [Streptomyces solisilvae]UHH19287.1 hypothetical protein LUV23_25185 [Streptomyces sp. HNM0561]
MPGKPRKHIVTLAGVVAAVQTFAVLLATRAAAEPSPSPSDDSDCNLLTGSAKKYCEKGDKSGGPPDPSNPLDPAASLARGCADAAAWLVGKLSKLVKETATVDFTNEAFLRQYAVVFAASTVLTLILWLLAVAKRAIRGVPLGEALSEAIGFLWLTVLASAFTPLILYTVVTATDAVTEAISSGTGADNDAFFGSFAQALKRDEDIGGGPIMLIVVSLVTILAAGVLCLELVIRAALLYVGALLGTAVYSGLVDKNMWGHVRRWAGIMIAVILVKPVIMIVLALAGALSTSGDKPDAFSAVVSGLAIIILAIFASAMIYRFVPGFGDEIVKARSASADPASRQAAAVISSPAALVKQGINTHSARGGGEAGGGGASPGQAKPANPVSGGVAAHSTRTGSGGASPAPASRTGHTGGSSGASATNRSSGNNSGGDRR